MSEMTISSRSRNLGYAWSNLPGKGSLEIVPAVKPEVTGGLRAIEQERSRALKLNASNFWSDRLFVAGEPVVAQWDIMETEDGWREGWLRVDSHTDITAILMLLRDGGTVRVRTEAG